MGPDHSGINGLSFRASAMRRLWTKAGLSPGESYQGMRAQGMSRLHYNALHPWLVSPGLPRSLANLCEVSSALMLFTLEAWRELVGLPLREAAPLQMNSSNRDTCHCALQLGAYTLRSVTPTSKHRHVSALLYSPALPLMAPHLQLPWGTSAHVT